MSATKRYPLEAINLYELLSAHFVDRLYNGSYATTVGKVESGESENINDEYRALLRTYLSAMKIASYCVRTVAAVHELYSQRIKFVTLPKFKALFARSFLPEEMIAKSPSGWPAVEMHECIRRIPAMLVDHMLEVNVFTNILNNHANVENVRELQQYAKRCCMTVREDIHAKYTRGVLNMSEETSISGALLEQKESEWNEKLRRYVNIEAELTASRNLIRTLAQQLKECKCKLDDAEHAKSQLLVTLQRISVANKVPARAKIPAPTPTPIKIPTPVPIKTPTQVPIKTPVTVSSPVVVPILTSPAKRVGYVPSPSATAMLMGTPKMRADSAIAAQPPSPYAKSVLQATSGQSREQIHESVSAFVAASVHTPVPVSVHTPASAPQTQTPPTPAPIHTYEIVTIEDAIDGIIAGAQNPVVSGGDDAETPPEHVSAPAPVVTRDSKSAGDDFFDTEVFLDD